MKPRHMLPSYAGGFPFRSCSSSTSILWALVYLVLPQCGFWKGLVCSVVKSVRTAGTLMQAASSLANKSGVGLRTARREVALIFYMLGLAY